MRFYNQQHRHYCGIDLHARTMYVCIIDRKGKTLVHRNIPTEPAPLLRVLKPYRKDLAIAVECMFCWYWLADLCAAEGIRFVLGHALYMKAIHGGKAKNDKIDSLKIAKLLRGGNLPEGPSGGPSMDASPSGREWGWVCGLLENGCPPERAYARLLDRSVDRRGSDAPRYARRTIERALKHIGDAATRRARHERFHDQPRR